MKYTTSNWTVSSLYNDTIQASKNIAVPDLDYAKDYKKSLDEPTEAAITNITGAEISSPEHIRIGATPVNNVYSGTGTELAAMSPSKKGVQTLVEINETYRATNTVTGEEIDLPCKGRIVLRFPTHSSVTEDMISDLLMRTISASFATGQTNAKRQVQIARGSLLPDGL